MLSIEEIKLLKEKLLKLKGTDWEKFLQEQIKILEDLELAVDAKNKDEINRLDKTIEWFSDTKNARMYHSNDYVI